MGSDISHDPATPTVDSDDPNYTEVKNEFIEPPGFCFTYTYDCTFISDKECCICSDEYKPNIVLHMLECNHVMHRTCLLHWYQTNQSCPLCRMGNVLEKDTSTKNGVFLQQWFT